MRVNVGSGGVKWVLNGLGNEAKDEVSEGKKRAYI